MFSESSSNSKNFTTMSKTQTWPLSVQSEVLPRETAIQTVPHTEFGASLVTSLQKMLLGIPAVNMQAGPSLSAEIPLSRHLWAAVVAPSSDVLGSLCRSGSTSRPIPRADRSIPAAFETPRLQGRKTRALAASWPKASARCSPESPLHRVGRAATWRRCGQAPCHRPDSLARRPLGPRA